MRHFLLTFVIIIVSAGSAIAVEPASFSGKPPVESARVRAFARVLSIAQGKANAATEAIQTSQASPENASGTAQAVSAIGNTMKLASGILEAEKLACEETGMSTEDYHEVKIRLLQVRMLQTLEKMTSGLVGGQSGDEMTAESQQSLERKLAGLEKRLADSREDLEKAVQGEAPYFAKLNDRIAGQREIVSNLQSEIPKLTDPDKRTAREKRLAAAQKQLAKLETERHQPYKKLVQARDKVAKHEKSVSVFKENMALTQQKVASMGQEIQQFQNKIASDSARIAESEAMQQARLDLPVFQQFPELQPFLTEP
ncbi:MAG TPA: hypothetical protein PLM07_11210 [Candidatus Rifleibacterium sp.]|nr:hypothetical protein [Candidatus Rifleibacterium sp.]HPT46460.1 hypothetical protein [Candidatus Rifleibacterium sp.]